MNAEKKLPVADNISSRRVCGIGTAMVALASFCPLLLAENLVRVDRDRFGGYQSAGSTVVARTKCTSRGYPTDTIEEIMVAIDSPDRSVRMSALILLVAQAGEEAVPVLKKALGDKNVFVRTRAAELLGSLGDAGGVPVLRADYEALIAKFTPSDPNRADPNMARAVLKGPDVYIAMSIAQVLAKFGDSRGFEQAAKIAAQDKWSHRLHALKVLFEINMWIDRAKLIAEKRDPQPILITAAESEKELHLLREFLNDALSCTRGDLRRTLLAKVENSSNAPQEMRNRARDLREQLERSHRKRK
jgi:hypothetical protein